MTSITRAWIVPKLPASPTTQLIVPTPIPIQRACCSIILVERES